MRSLLVCGNLLATAALAILAGYSGAESNSFSIDPKSAGAESAALSHFEGRVKSASATKSFRIGTIMRSTS